MQIMFYFPRFNDNLLCFSSIYFLFCLCKNANFPGMQSRLLIGCLVTNQKLEIHGGVGGLGAGRNTDMNYSDQWGGTLSKIFKSFCEYITKQIIVY